MIRVSLTRVGAAAAVALALLVSPGNIRAEEPTTETNRTPAADVAPQALDNHAIAQARPFAATAEDMEGLFTPAAAALDDCTDSCAELFNFCIELNPPRVCLPMLRRCIAQCREY